MRLGMGLVATMTALLLGLVTASARSTFDSQDAAMRTSASNILTLDRLLATYGPETQGHTRDLIRTFSRLPDRDDLAERRFAQARACTRTPTTQRLEEIEKPDPPAGARHRRAALVQGRVAEAERRGHEVALADPEQPGGSVPLGVPDRGDLLADSHVLQLRPLRPAERLGLGGILVVAALSVAAAVFLILELDGPFDGLIKVSSGPLRFTLAQLGQ